MRRTGFLTSSVLTVLMAALVVSLFVPALAGAHSFSPEFSIFTFEGRDAPSTDELSSAGDYVANANSSPGIDVDLERNGDGESEQALRSTFFTFPGGNQGLSIQAAGSNFQFQPSHPGGWRSNGESEVRECPLSDFEAGHVSNVTIEAWKHSAAAGAGDGEGSGEPSRADSAIDEIAGAIDEVRNSSRALGGPLCSAETNIGFGRVKLAGWLVRNDKGKGLIDSEQIADTYLINSTDYYRTRHPEWSGYGESELPVVAGLSFRDPALRALVNPIFVETTLDGQNRLANAVYDVARIASGVDPLLSMRQFELLEYGGADRGRFRTPPVGVCDTTQNFDATATSWPDSMYGTPIGEQWGAQPDQTFATTVATSPLNNCTSDLRFQPRLTVETNSSQAGASPSLKMKIERDKGDAYLTGIGLGMHGMLGSNLAADLCDETTARLLACPESSKVADADMTIAVFEHRRVSLHGNVYAAPPVGGELMRLLTVVEGRPVTENRTIVIPASIFAEDQAKGIKTQIDGLPTEFDVRELSFTFNGSKGAPEHPLLVNPTSCAGTSISAEFASETGQVASSEVPYAVTGCDSLAFTPKLEVGLSCSDPNCAPSITEKISQPIGEAATESMEFKIPPGFALNTKSDRKICSKDDAARASCPDASRVGSVVAKSNLLADPLQGKVYLTDSDDPNAFHGIHVDLQGLVNASLDGSLVSAEGGGFATIIAGMPDVPLTSTELTLEGGNEKGLIRNSTACSQFDFSASLTSHSGKTVSTSSPVQLAGPECAPSLAVFLSSHRPRARPSMDVTVRPVAGTAPLKRVELSLGSGAASLAVVKARLRTSGEKGDRSKALGSLSLRPADGGRTSSATLLSVRSGSTLRIKRKSRGSLSLSTVGIRLAGHKLILTNLPNKPLEELEFIIKGGRRGPLVNPRKRGEISFKADFVDINGAQNERMTATRIK